MAIFLLVELPHVGNDLTSVFNHRNPDDTPLKVLTLAKKGGSLSLHSTPQAHALIEGAAARNRGIVRQQLNATSDTWAANKSCSASGKKNTGRIDVTKLSRRSVLGGSFGLATAGALGRPFIAKAAPTTVSVWWPQGFVRVEDVGFTTVVGEYEKVSGN